MFLLGDFGRTVLSRQTELRAQIFCGIVPRANSFISGGFPLSGVDWNGCWLSNQTGLSTDQNLENFVFFGNIMIFLILVTRFGILKTTLHLHVSLRYRSNTSHVNSFVFKVWGEKVSLI